jgi:NADPH-dependent glutamate synthase beta subunit-like oxidoreductase
VIPVDQRSATIILGVEGEPADLGDLERELSKRYRQDHAVVCGGSPSHSLGTLGRLRDQVGAGPAGLGAAVYAAPAGLEVLVVERRSSAG